MGKKSLIDTNPYLKDSKKYLDALITNVSSSTAIETGESIQTISQNISNVAHGIFSVTPVQQKSK